MAEYIERKAVEKFIEDGLNCPNSIKAFGFDAVEILTEVHYMPAADVAPVVHGKWIHDGRRCKSGVDWCHCSECGKQDIFAARTNYCPDCGAKMDLEDK